MPEAFHASCNISKNADPKRSARRSPNSRAIELASAGFNEATLARSAAGQPMGLPAPSDPRPIELSQDQMLREMIDAIELMARERPIALFLED